MFDLLDSECIAQHGSDANFLETCDRQLRSHRKRAAVRGLGYTSIGERG